MANELSNATKLMGDSEFRAWVMAASVYQARIVFTEAATVPNHSVRLELAMGIISNPAAYNDRFVNILACDPDIAGLGTSVGSDIPQGVLIAKVAEIWNPLAKYIAAPAA